MKTLYIECAMGAAGDMLMSALSELIDDAQGFVDRFNAIGLEGVIMERCKAEKCGITGTHIRVMINGLEEHEHRHDNHHHHSHGTSFNDVKHIISRLNIPQNVKHNAEEIYRIIAEAESTAHGRHVSEIHFHEVGTMDAIADVVGSCILIEEISPERIIVSPINVGSGTVKCAHGVLPVPAPATAHILLDVPIYSSEIKGELCTPTGAAVLKYFADEFGSMPVMRTAKIGYGMGTKDFPAANCVRIMLGETENLTDTVSELICNIDDMTGEEIGFAEEILFEAGALDVFTTPIYMKKNRPAVMLTCMCHADKRDEMLHLIFKHTSTIGVREHISNRYVLHREQTVIHTKHGDVTAKISKGYGVSKIKPEYEDMARIAREKGISIERSSWL